MSLNPYPEYLLVSQIFPPAVGGSGVLLDNVYSRVPEGHVTALVDEATCGALRHPVIEAIPVTISPHAWGLITPSSWSHHFRLARQIYAHSRNGTAIVHCGRAQPEGIGAYIASYWPGGAPYAFWAHGEDISAALSSRQFAITTRLVYGRASAAIANSRNTARLLQQTGWLRVPVDVIYPGVDSVRFSPAADDGSRRGSLASSDDILLVSVARLMRRKGHDLVIRALPELLRRHRVRYAIVGDGPELENLKRLAVELGVGPAVHFTGEVPDTDLPSYFAAADVFVLPTRIEVTDFEGFGIVFLEAAAAGKPAVGGRNGGVPEAIVDGVTGLLVDADDLAALTRVLDRLCESRSLRESLGMAGRRRAQTEFTWEAAARGLATVHERIATSGSRSAAV